MNQFPVFLAVSECFGPRKDSNSTVASCTKTQVDFLQKHDVHSKPEYVVCTKNIKMHESVCTHKYKQFSFVHPINVESSAHVHEVRSHMGGLDPNHFLSGSHEDIMKQNTSLFCF